MESSRIQEARADDRRRLCVDFRGLNALFEGNELPGTVIVSVILNGRRVLIRALPHEAELLLQDPESEEVWGVRRG